VCLFTHGIAEDGHVGAYLLSLVSHVVREKNDELVGILLNHNWNWWQTTIGNKLSM